MAGGCAAIQLSSWPARLSYPGELSDIEGMRLVEMLHLREGTPIYAFPTGDRFDASIYGPIYYLLGAQLVDPSAPSVIVLRGVSALATLGLAACCAMLAYWLSRRVPAAILAALMFLSYGFVTRQGISARSDLAAVLLAFLGFLVAFRYRNDRRILLAVPLMVLSFFYKQQYVAGPLAVLLFLFLERRFRQAAEFFSLLTMSGLTLLAIFQFGVFSGQAFFHHFFLFNATPFSWTQFKYAGLMFFLIVLLVPLLIGMDFLRRHPQALLGCYLACSVLLASVTVSKLGSDAHYWLECVLVLSALTASTVTEGILEQARALELTCLLGIALFFAQFFSPPGPHPRDFAHDAAIQKYLRQNFPPHTPALSQWAGDLVRAGLDVPISDLAQYEFLVRVGTLSDRPLLDQIHGRRFGLIVTNYDMRAEPPSRARGGRLPGAWAAAILANYQPAANLEMPNPEKVWPDDRFHIWIPRPATSQDLPPQSQ